MQIREGLAIVDDELKAIGQALAALARRYRDTPIVGRSNLQQAIPVTFGYKMATILAAVIRHRERLLQLNPRVLVGELGGACGTLASIEKHAMEMQAAVMAEPTWGSRPSPTQCAMASPRLISAWSGHARQAVDGREAADANRSGEAYEPFVYGRGSSSTMPQKRNPISSC
jgi:3-carboxy-cis,cis-muconate cycloisomerase